MSTYEKFETFCIVQCLSNATANYTICTETDYTDCSMYPKRIMDLEYLVPVTFVFFLMFLSGLLGNLSVCTVILKHPSMRSETNAYLFSLAVSDILLLVFGLIPELCYYWQTYPYDFGEFTCRITKFLAATGTWASALTVVAFSIERYIAICHHSRFDSRGNKRVAMAIIAIWVTSVAVALPVLHVYHVVMNPKVVYPGLIPELCYYWQTYPYDFGEFTCRITKFLAATGTWASALTVVAFSIERYIAICHHSRFDSRGNKRVAMAIIAIWVTSVAVALPVLHVYHVVMNPKVVYPGTGKIPLLTQTCRIPIPNPDLPEVYKYAYYKHLYAITCVVLFFIPMAVLMLMYIKIALYLRKHRKQARNNGIKNNCSENTKVFKILVAVVLAFFVCGAPFHYQRLTAALHSKISKPDDKEYYRHVLVITGLFYYLSATINPILYNAMSKRYRKAFKEIISGNSGTKKQNDIPLNTVAKDSENIKKKMCTTNSYTTVPTSA